jgi:hypothetical protein
MTAANTKAPTCSYQLPRDLFLKTMLPIITPPKIGPAIKIIIARFCCSWRCVSSGICSGGMGSRGAMGFAKAADEGRSPKRNCSHKISRSFFMPSNKGDLDFTAKDRENIH